MLLEPCDPGAETLEVMDCSHPCGPTDVVPRIKWKKCNGSLDPPVSSYVVAQMVNSSKCRSICLILGWEDS